MHDLMAPLNKRAEKDEIEGGVKTKVPVKIKEFRTDDII